MFNRSVYFSSLLLRFTTCQSLNFYGFFLPKRLLKINQLVCRFSNDSISSKARDASTSLSEFDERKKQSEKIVEQVKLMNEYYSQYIDEYYEECGDDDDFDIESLIDNTVSKGFFLIKKNFIFF